MATINMNKANADWKALRENANSSEISLKQL